MEHDYAKALRRQAWLRHPSLGDPSFDAFEKIGDTVHRSRPPYEWAVNGSLFRDPPTGDWYLYAGLYPYGYSHPQHPGHFVIYRSRSQGDSWECLGRGFEDEYFAGEVYFPGRSLPLRSCPDVVMQYDAETGLYWLTYDWSTKPLNGESTPDDDSGAALAWSESPAGPFHRLDAPFFSNREQKGKLGRFTRGYASTVLKRRRDWIAFILLDSWGFDAWGLCCMTAPRPEGPWSEPRLLLSGDRMDYYPAPVEFYPCFVHQDKVYAPATSVAGNRNYQALFAADLEDAHHPQAWSLVQDGGFWHSRPLEDEAYGIWGQTVHGFVHEGRLVVMYPAKDSRDCGTLSVAARPWDEPFTDGFTLSGHQGRSLSPLLAAYRDFTLDAAFTLTGGAELLLRYGGILGPDRHGCLALAHDLCFASSSGLVMEADGNWRMIARDKQGTETTLSAGRLAEAPASLHVEIRRGTALIEINGTPVWRGSLPDEAAPLAVAVHQWSLLACSQFRIQGDAERYALRYNALDALLNAMQPQDWAPDNPLPFACREGFTGEGAVRAKWNINGDGFRVFSPKGPGLGSMEIWVDGYFCGTADLHADVPQPSAPVYVVSGLSAGRHGVLLQPWQGRMAVDLLEVTGPPEPLLKEK